jgi:hypothetical protein
MVSPWSRFRKATAGRLCYKARVCIEGVPSSAHNREAVKGLFDSSIIFDSIDNSLNSKEDSACFKVWVWMANVGSLARRGLLDLEEPLEVDSPLLHFPELGILADRPVRSGPVKTLSYNIILHLDRVLDYSGSPPSSPESHMSIRSDVSGLPSETSSTPEFPVTWGYRWYLGYEAGTFPPSRASARSRLSYPDGRGGGAGGAGGGGGAGARGGGEAQQGRSSRWDQQANQQRYGQQLGGAGGSAGGHRQWVATAMETGVAVERDQEQQSVQILEPMGTTLLPLDGPAADLFQLMDADMQPGQLTPVMGSLNGMEADVPDGVVETMQGHAGKGSRFEEEPAEKTAFVEATVMHETGSANPGSADQSKVDGAEDALFGPHSPRELVGQDGALGNPAQPPAGPFPTGHDTERAAENQEIDPLQEFIVNHSAPVAPALLPSPLEATAAAKSGRSRLGGETPKKSTRLAAKPTAGLSTMEKISIVLLKKSGAPISGAQPQGSAVQRLADLYTRPLPSNFIKAATALVEAGSASKAFAAMEGGQVASA